MMQINQTEAQQIAGFILFCFNQIHKKYDFKKYPKYVYNGCKIKFSALNNAANQNIIHDALVWKYGHWGKSNFPAAHYTVIQDVQKLWPQFIKTGKHHSPHCTFQWWQRKWPKRRYITVAFITHLIHNSAIPIIDQHNFRAMNTLIDRVKKNHRYKKAPSCWQDILDLKYFMRILLPYLNNVNVSDLDRFLMMWGKIVKT